MFRLQSILIACLLFFSSPIFADSEFVNRPDVKQFIQYMVTKHHFQPVPLTNLFEQVKLRSQVLYHVKNPLEKKTWDIYQLLFVSEWRIKQGVAFWKQYAESLKKAEELYGVPASIIVATIGIETKYGQRIGEYRVIDSLANLAFSTSPRAPFFRKELEEFLLLTRDQQLNPLKIMGSYAGAIGQPQFMPSSYRYYAVNFSKSGKIDLMHNEIDVIGSVANYYKKHGWKSNEPIAAQAYLLKDGSKLATANKILAIPEWKKYGITTRKSIAAQHLKVKLIELENRTNKEYWFGFSNFDVIKRYNPSDLYAMAVYQLSENIIALKNKE